MYSLDYRLRKAALAGAFSAVGALALTVVGPAAAQTATRLTSPSQMKASDSTLLFTGGGSFLPSYAGTVGGNTLTFTASNGTLQLQNEDDFGGAFPSGTNLLETIDGTGGSTGPMTITFASGVQEFGLSAQDFTIDTQTFTFSVTSGTRSLGSFTLPPSDNASGSGQIVFLGASAPAGFGITSVTISSDSSGPRGANGFAVGPVTSQTLASAPEPSESLALGLGLLLLGTLALRARRLAIREKGMNRCGF